MTNLVEPLLDVVAAYGLLGLGAALLLAAAGLPLPTGALLVAVGALARDGALDWRAAALVALAGVVLGDVAGYCLGRLAGGWVARFGRGPRAALWHRAQALFDRHGALAVCSTRFLLTSLDKPASLIAGGTGYDLRRFVLYALAGRAAWLSLYGGLGYAFGAHSQVMSHAVENYGGLLVAAAVVAGAVCLLKRQSGLYADDGNHRL